MAYYPGSIVHVLPRGQGSWMLLIVLKGFSIAVEKNIASLRFYLIRI
jgi:hypothetical protein